MTHPVGGKFSSIFVWLISRRLKKKKEKEVYDQLISINVCDYCCSDKFRAAYPFLSLLSIHFWVSWVLISIDGFVAFCPSFRTIREPSSFSSWTLLEVAPAPPLSCSQKSSTRESRVAGNSSQTEKWKRNKEARNKWDREERKRKKEGRNNYLDFRRGPKLW